MELTQQFLQYQRDERQASPYTLRNYEHSLREYARYHNEAYQVELISGKSWDAVTIPQARDYVIELQRGLDRRTVHNRVAALRSFYRWGVRQGFLKANPFKHVHLPKLPRKLPIFLTEAQVERLLAAPRERMAAGYHESLALRDELLLELLYGAGLRVSELCGLTWESVDWERGLLRVLGKGRKERLCPTGPVALTKLRTFQKNGDRKGRDFIFAGRVKETLQGSLSPREVQLLLKKYLKLAELPNDLTPHKLRHTFATHMVGRGANLRAVQELMGHKNLTTTQIYAHLTLGTVREAYRKAHPRA